MLEVHNDSFADHLRMELVLARKDQVIGRIDLADQHLDAAGRVHGAVIMGLADMVAAHATTLNLPRGAGTATLESKTIFIHGVRDGPITAEAVPLHIGSSTMMWQTTVRDPNGRPLAVVTQTQLILEGDRTGGPRTRPTENLCAVSEAADRNAALVSSDTVWVDATAEDAPADARRPQSTPDLRRAQILRAAFKVISKKGFSNAATREIAQEAGLSVPAMYQYVRSKDELLEGIFNAYLTKVESSVQLSTIKTQSATAKLRAAITANMVEFDRFQAEIRVMNRETQALRPEVRRRVKKHMLSYIELFRGIIDDGIASGEFREVEPGLYANFVPMLCDVWPLRNWAVGAHGVDDVRDAIIDLMLHALAPTRGRAA